MNEQEKRILDLEKENKELRKKIIILLEKIIELKEAPPKVEYIPMPGIQPYQPYVPYTPFYDTDTTGKTIVGGKTLSREVNLGYGTVKRKSSQCSLAALTSFLGDE